MLAAVVLVVAVVLLVYIMLAPFVTLTYGDVPTYLEVNKRAEAHLYYPGSKILSVQVVGDSPAMEGGPIPAHASALLATDAASSSPDRVLSWYRNYLTLRGWTEVSAGSFRRGSEIFTIKSSNPGQYRVLYAVRPCRFGDAFCFGS